MGGPKSSTGWHTHPGKTLVSVKSGTFRTTPGTARRMSMDRAMRSSSCRRPSTSAGMRPTASSNSPWCSSGCRSAGALESTSPSRRTARSVSHAASGPITRLQEGLTSGPSNGVPSVSDQSRSSSCTAIGNCSNHHPLRRLLAVRDEPLRHHERHGSSSHERPDHPWTSGLRKRCMMAPSGRDALHAV